MHEIFLTRASLGYSAERAPLGGGGADSAAPLFNSRTDDRRKTEKRQTKALKGNGRPSENMYFLIRFNYNFGLN